MTSAFYQIELDQDCRFITAFQPDNRIKSFKRPDDPIKRSK